MASSNQNIIALIWDFDKTLTPNYMQQVIFDEYQVDSNTFWKEVDALAGTYRENGCVNVTQEMLYLDHILKYTHTGRFAGLCNDKLKELGSRIEFFAGLPAFFPHLKQMIQDDKQCKEHGIVLEHYIVSSGLRNLIAGSQIEEHLDGIWACEFLDKGEDGERVLDRIAYVIDDTTKTRAIFEISKGTNKIKGLTVNDYIPHDQRRVPIRNMLYVADGPSDVPVFSIVKSNGGVTYGVYDANRDDGLEKVDNLREQGRINHYSKADYSLDKEAAQWIEMTVKHMAQKIIKSQDSARMTNIGVAPTHTT